MKAYTGSATQSKRENSSAAWGFTARLGYYAWCRSITDPEHQERILKNNGNSAHIQALSDQGADFQMRVLLNSRRLRPESTFCLLKLRS